MTTLTELRALKEASEKVLAEYLHRNSEAGRFEYLSRRENYQNGCVAYVEELLAAGNDDETLTRELAAVKARIAELEAANMPAPGQPRGAASALVDQFNYWLRHNAAVTKEPK